MDMKLLSIIDNPVILVIILVAIFGVIVLGVILIKKYVPAFKNTDKPKSEKEIAEEEVDRLVVDIEEGLTEKKEDEAAKEAAKAVKKEVKEAKEGKPSEEEALQYEMDRLLVDAPEAKEKKEDEEDK